MKQYNFSVTVYKKIDHKLNRDWLELEKNCYNYFFQSLDFIKNYLLFKKNIKDINLNLVVVRSNQDQSIMCIFPFQIVNLFGVKILQWLGTRDVDYCSPIIRKNINLDLIFSSIWKETIKHIDGYDLIFLDRQPMLIGEFKNPFIEFLPSKIFSKSYITKLSNNFSNDLNLVKNKKFLSEFNRTEKKLQSNNEVEFKVIFEKDTSLSLSNIIKNKIFQLNKLQIKHNLNEDLINFFEKIKENCPKKIILAALYINNEIIAASFNFSHKERFYYYMPTVFNEKYNKFSPGKILISYLLNWSSVNNINTFDFGIGEENYKKYWASDSINLYRYLNFKTFKGFMFFIIFKLYLLKPINKILKKIKLRSF